MSRLLATRRWTLAGCVSWGFGCGSGLPGVYTKINGYMDFILKYAKNAQTIEGDILKPCDN